MADNDGELTGDKWESLVERVAREIYEGTLLGIISPDMVKRMAQELMGAVYEGSGMDFDTKTLTGEDREMLEALENNVFVFSGFKNYQQLREVSDLLTDEAGNVRDFKDFLEDVKAIDNTYNVNYARAEYNTALNTSRQMSAWQTFEKEKRISPLLIWVTAEQETTCDVCSALDGTTLPVDDPFWNTHNYPVHFNCNCTIMQAASDEEQTPDNEVPQPEYPEAWKMFQRNPAKDGVVFPDKHPYFQVQQKEKEKIMKVVHALIPEHK